MIDPGEIEMWRPLYRDSAYDAVPKPISISQRRKIAAWAASMALIAEQFVPEDDDEMEDAAT